METRSAAVKSNLATRLRRIEGQVRGVQRMVEEDRDCAEILQQMTAIRSAVHQASLALARDYAAHCLTAAAPGDNVQMLDKLMTALERLDG